MLWLRRIAGIAALVVLYFLLPSSIYIVSIILLFAFVLLAVVAVDPQALRDIW